MLKQLSLFISVWFFAGIFYPILAQNIPIGTWQDHLPYRDAVSVTEGNNIIYCATNSTVFTYDLADNSIERLNLVTGLSDIGISKVKYNSYNNRVIVAYNNGNIDIIDENKSIINLPAIKISNIIGDKSIYNIYLQNHLAYLSTGFGIVVIDTDKLEVKDTYYIGTLGAYIQVNSITMDTLNIYAATENGMYYATKSNPNLADYNEWEILPDLKSTSYSNVLYFNKMLVAIEDRNSLPDSIFYGVSGTWQPFVNPEGFTNNICLLQESSIAIIWDWGVSFYDHNLSKYGEIYDYSAQEIIRAKSFEFWMADENVGLVHFSNPSDPNKEIITPNSTSTTNVFDIDYINGHLWTVSGGYGIGLNEFLFNHKSDGTWSNFPKNTDNGKGGWVRDMVSVLINPNNPSNVYIGSWLNGLLEINNDVITNIYDGNNSLLDTLFYANITSVSAMSYDDNNNLWVTSSFTKNNILAVKTPNNIWYNYSFPDYSSEFSYYPKMIVDNNNFKWIISPNEHEVIVFDDNNTLDDKGDDRVTANNRMPGTIVECITEDQDGEIWVGTDEGIAVYYNPSEVFDKNIEAQQIYIQQEGQTQILLETETVTAIEVDGANRKWIGTQNAGVYLMSADGTEQIEHFTTENSPLFSNNIFDIEIDHKTGEVYFATEKGLISYKGTATEPLNDFEIFVYPNPVKPDYEGVIAIRGLVKDTDVRITDISGNIVYETNSLGGQAIWDGKDFHGNRVQSGVYMVFNGSQDGNLKAAAKILFLN